jgi:hypothetical protein
MAVNDIKAGFIGLAKVDGTYVRCTDFSINPRQTAQFYDHIIGLRDTIPKTIFEGKGDEDTIKPQKKIWRPSVKIYQGQIGYPLTLFKSPLLTHGTLLMHAKIKSPLLTHAKKGTDFDINFAYTCKDIIRKFTGCKVNQYTFSITAGDFAKISADIMAVSGEDMAVSGEDSNNQSRYTEVEKLITWDDVTIKIDNVWADCMRSFTFTVNNNCKPIYTAGKNNDGDKLNPAVIRVGMQEVTGSISYYNKGEDLSFMEDIDSVKKISISMSDGFDVDLNVIFQPQERTSAIGPIISNLPFVGVDYAMGE